MKNILAAVLLTVFMPMAALLPFHHHDEAEHQDHLECQACAQDLPHQGHLTEDLHLQDCILCHLQGANYLPGTEQVYNCTADYCSFIEAIQYKFVPDLYKQPASQRAPPASFC